MEYFWIYVVSVVIVGFISTTNARYLEARIIKRTILEGKKISESGLQFRIWANVSILSFMPVLNTAILTLLIVVIVKEMFLTVTKD